MVPTTLRRLSAMWTKPDAMVSNDTPSRAAASGLRLFDAAAMEAVPNLTAVERRLGVVLTKNVYQNYRNMSTTDARKVNDGSLFRNFEDVRLTDEERVFLNAAALGDVGCIRETLEDGNSQNLNVNCVDYMGRNALHLAVDSENVEIVEHLLDKLAFQCIEDALLHAISKGATKIVKVIVEHPNYMAQEDKIKRMDYNEAFFRESQEKSQFSPDITPLVLSAHYNNHEIIQLFLARKHTIEKPHVISCQCRDCQVKQRFDSLKRSRSRLNAYRALASPAYIVLSSPDPIMTTFELRQEMMALAEVEKEFKNEYLSLVDQCMIFACEMMDLCRGTQEVEAVMSESDDPLKRLRMAMYYEEKKFVAHANCQQHLTTTWYGSEMAFLQSFSSIKQMGLFICGIPLLPLLCLSFMVAPNSKLGRCMCCPITRFATGTVSHIIFLVLLSAATLRLEEGSYPIISSPREFNDSRFSAMTEEEKIQSVMRETLRPTSRVITIVQICIMVYIIGSLLQECKQIYAIGLRSYLYDNYNLLDFIILSLYLSSYTLRIMVDFWVKLADERFNATKTAHQFLVNGDYQGFIVFVSNIKKRPSSPADLSASYFMKGSRFEWESNDPEIVSDVLFAIANVLSFAKVTFIMPAFQILGPLQISFARMLGDIMRFMVLFLLVLFAFMVGLHNLYWYYGSRDVMYQGRLVPASEPFEGLKHTLYSLFWCMFGQVSLPSMPVRRPGQNDHKYTDGLPVPEASTAVVEAVGMTLVALYHVIIIIVLVNMLIAMMSHSFERIQQDTDVEWKFARTRLWLTYIDNDSILPVPFNMIPTPQLICEIYRSFRESFCDSSGDAAHRHRNNTFIKNRRVQACREVGIQPSDTSYRDIMQRLVRRYLFKMERERKNYEDKIKESFMPPGVSIRAEDFADPGDDDSPSKSPSNAAPFGFDNMRLGSRGLAGIARMTHFADEDGQDDILSPPSLAPPPPPPPLSGIADSPSFRRGTRKNKRRGSSVGLTGNAMQPGGVQVLAIPQLDGIQRTQKILDMRMQSLHQQMDQINLAAGSHRIREELEHIRQLISENQKAMGSVVKVISSIQEQIRMLNENMHEWVMAQVNSRQLKTTVVSNTKESVSAAAENPSS